MNLRRKRQIRLYLIMLTHLGPTLYGPYKTYEAREAARLKLRNALHAGGGVDDSRFLNLDAPFSAHIHPEDRRPVVDEILRLEDD